MSWKYSGIVKSLTHLPIGRKLKSNEKLFLLILADYSNEHTGTSWPSIERLATECLCSTRTIQRMIAQMARAGFIEVQRREGHSSKYTLLLEHPGRLFGGDSVTGVTHTVTTTPDTAVSPRTVSGTVNNKTILLAQFPEWLPVPEWNTYLEMRKRLRKPLVTNRGIGMAIGKLESLRKAGNDPKLVLEQSIFNSWKGLFELQPKYLSRSEPDASVGKLNPERKIPDYSAEVAEILKRHPDLA